VTQRDAWAGIPSGPSDRALARPALTDVDRRHHLLRHDVVEHVADARNDAEVAPWRFAIPRRRLLPNIGRRCPL
jgi:hypothetical protein